MKASHLDADGPWQLLTTRDRVGDGSPGCGFQENPRARGVPGDALRVKDDPFLTTRADLAKRRGRAVSSNRAVPSAAELGLVGSATTRRTGRTSRPRRSVPIPLPHCNVTDDAAESVRVVLEQPDPGPKSTQQVAGAPRPGLRRTSTSSGQHRAPRPTDHRNVGTRGRRQVRERVPDRQALKGAPVLS